MLARFLPIPVVLAALLVPAPAMALVADAPPSASAQAAKAGAVVTTRNIPGFGQVLVDGSGLPLYIFTADRGRTSRCYGECAKAWPVVFAQGSPRARGAARSALLGTTRRSDGGVQVTYRGRPVYRYVHDRPGVALCHDVREFGGLWLLVRANGKRV